MMVPQFLRAADLKLLSRECGATAAQISLAKLGFPQKQQDVAEMARTPIGIECVNGSDGLLSH